MAEAVIKTVPPFAGNHQSCCLQQFWSQSLHLLQMLEQAIPLIGRVTQLELIEGGFAQAAGLTQIAKCISTGVCSELCTEPAGGQCKRSVQLVAARQLLFEFLLLRTIDGLHRQLISAGKVKHHLAETLTLKLHQELDGVSSCAAGEAVIELLGRRHRHGRLAVVVKRADADKFTTLFLEHDVLTHNIHDVGAFLDGLDGAWVKSGADHQIILRETARPVDRNCCFGLAAPIDDDPQQA